MTPKELETLTHNYGMVGNLNDTCIGSLYSEFYKKGVCCSPTLLYLGGDEPDTVYISRTVEGQIIDGCIYMYGDIPPNNPEHLLMTDGYKPYKMTQDKEIEAAVASLALQVKRLIEQFKLEEIKKDFEDGTDEM